ncbi:MAG: hypothetical protein AAF721_05950 [Myxococcota bacterium]
MVIALGLGCICCDRAGEAATPSEPVVAQARPPKAARTAALAKPPDPAPVESTGPGEPVTDLEAPAPPVVPDRRYEETIAGLRLGMTLAEAMAVIPTLVAKSKQRQITPNSSVPGPETYYDRTFEDPGADLSIVVASKRPDGEQRIQWIHAEYDATAATTRGIKIGDKARAFKRAYKKRIMPLPGEYWIRYSDDEMLVVLIDEGAVYSMSLGPAMNPEDLEE